MVSLSFSLERFIYLIREGVKDQTVRPLNAYSSISDRRSRAWQLANARKYELYFKQRLPEGFKIGDGLKKEFLLVNLHQDYVNQVQVMEALGVKAGDEGPEVIRRVSVVEMKNGQFDEQDFAVRDGFKNYKEMLGFFYEHYGVDFTHQETWMVPRWNFLEDNLVKRAGS